MYSKSEFMCTLKGSLLRIVFPRPCLNRPDPTTPDCLHYVRVEGLQTLGHLKRNCTAEMPIKDTDLKPAHIATIVLSIVVILLIPISIVLNRKR